MLLFRVFVGPWVESLMSDILKVETQIGTILWVEYQMVTILWSESHIGAIM